MTFKAFRLFFAFDYFAFFTFVQGMLSLSRKSVNKLAT